MTDAHQKVLTMRRCDTIDPVAILDMLTVVPRGI
jgi:hypothetical protein